MSRILTLLFGTLFLLNAVAEDITLSDVLYPQTKIEVSAYAKRLTEYSDKVIAEKKLSGVDKDRVLQAKEFAFKKIIFEMNSYKEKRKAYLQSIATSGLLSVNTSYKTVVDENTKLSSDFLLLSESKTLVAANSTTIEAPAIITTVAPTQSTTAPTVGGGDWNETNLDPLSVPALQLNVTSPSLRNSAFANVINTAEIWIMPPVAITNEEADQVAASLTYGPDGWPLSLPANYYMTMGPRYMTSETLAHPSLNTANAVTYLKGVFVLTWKGEATVTVLPTPNITDINLFEIIKTSPNRIIFLVKSNQRYPTIKIQNINPLNPINSVRLWAPVDDGAGLNLTSASILSVGAIASSTEPAVGATEPIWHPKYLAFQHDNPAKVLRFMDWHRINGVTETTPLEWSDRAPLNSIAPKLSVIGASYSRRKPPTIPWRLGLPLELLVDLSNTLDKDIWFNIPHTASDDFIRKLARFFAGKENGIKLKSGRRIWMEFSNEIWNGQSSYLPQLTMAINAAATKFGVPAKNVIAGGDMHAWGSGYIQARALKIFEDEWRLLGQSDESLVNVFSGFAISSNFNNKMLLAAKEVNPLLPETLAITNYFGDEITSEIYNGFPFGADPGNWPASLYQSTAKTVRRGLVDRSKSWKASADIAQAHNIPIVAYEGGQHILATGHGDWTNLAHRDFMRYLESFEESREMEGLYRYQYALWRAAGGQMASIFLDFSAYSYFGYWGAKRYLFQTDTQASKWSAVKNWGIINPDDIRPMHLPLNFAPRLSVNRYSAEVGIPSSADVVATGGDGQVTISLLGGVLPPGITLTPASSGHALLAGTPMGGSGEYPAVLRAIDQDKDVHDFQITFVIDPAGTSTNAFAMFNGSNIPASGTGNIYTYGRYDIRPTISQTITTADGTIKREYVPFSATTHLFKAEPATNGIVLSNTSSSAMFGGVSISFGPSATFGSNKLIGLLDGGFTAWTGDSITKTTMDYFLFWNKEQFINDANNRTITFGTTPEKATLHLDLKALAENQNKIRFVIRDGNTWYMSEAEFSRTYVGDGIFEITQFQNSSLPGKRWAVVTPTENSYSIPDNLQFNSHQFSNVQAVGIMGTAMRTQWNFLFKFNRFFALGQY